MNYLLTEILVCLLVAGLIGLVIGWFLRGGCKTKLLEKEREDEERLKEKEAVWKKQVQTLISEKESDKHRMKKELQEYKDKMYVLEQHYKELEDRNSQLTSEREKIRDIYAKEFEDEILALEHRVGELMQQLSEDRTTLKVKESDLKEHIALNKTLRAREIAWKSKVQGLMTENKQSKERLKNELNRVKSQLSLVETELKDCLEQKN